MKYLVNEIFQSVKGEGLYVGTPMQFVRLAHCNLVCDHCDTRFNEPSMEMTEIDIINELQKNPQLKKVVLTGGEPTNQDIRALMDAFRISEYSVHLESNGTKRFNPADFDWICISPKIQYQVPLRESLSVAHEIKMPISNSTDIEMAEAYRRDVTKFTRMDALWYLHPWNDEFEFKKIGSEMDEEGARTMKGWDVGANHLCIEHAKKTGTWRVSIQAHKVWAIR